MKLLLTVIITGIFMSCSDSKFQADGGPKAPPETADLQKQPYSPSQTFTPDPLCENTTSLDEEAQFVFSNGGEITQFIAQATGAPNAPGTATAADVETADFICKKKGYERSTGLTTGRFKSCHDNFLIYLDPNTKRTGIRSACDQNRKLDAMICMGKQVTVDCHGNPVN